MQESTRRLREFQDRGDVDKTLLANKVADALADMLKGMELCVREKVEEGRSFWWWFVKPHASLWYKTGLNAMLSLGPSLNEIEGALEGDGDATTRSACLLVLGLFHTLLDVASPKLCKVVKNLPETEHQRFTGVTHLATCMDEGGIMAPLAALAIATINTRLSRVLHERVSLEDPGRSPSQTKDALEWFAKNAKDSPLDVLLRTEAAALGRKVNRALTNWESGENKLVPADDNDTKLKSSLIARRKWLVYYKKGLLNLCNLQFEDAAKLFEAAMQQLMKKGLDDYYPFTLALATLCYFTAADIMKYKELDRRKQAGLPLTMEDGSDFTDTEAGEKLRKKGVNMAELLWAAKSKPNAKQYLWGREDDVSSWVFLRHFEESEMVPFDDSSSGAWPLVNLVEFMVIYLRITEWMEKAKLIELAQLLKRELARKEEINGNLVDDFVRCHLVLMEVKLQAEDYKGALTVYSECLKLEDGIKVSKPGLYYGKGLGVIQYVHMLAAETHRRRGSVGSLETMERAVGDWKSFKYGLSPHVGM